MTGGNGKLLATAIILILAITGWTLGHMIPFFILMRVTGLLRVDEAEERMGLDVSHHGGSAYEGDPDTGTAKGGKMVDNGDSALAQRCAACCLNFAQCMNLPTLVSIRSRVPPVRTRVTSVLLLALAWPSARNLAIGVCAGLRSWRHASPDRTLALCPSPNKRVLTACCACRAPGQERLSGAVAVQCALVPSTRARRGTCCALEPAGALDRLRTASCLWLFSPSFGGGAFVVALLCRCICLGRECSSIVSWVANASAQQSDRDLCACVLLRPAQRHAIACGGWGDVISVRFSAQSHASQNRGSGVPLHHHAAAALSSDRCSDNLWPSACAMVTEPTRPCWCVHGDAMLDSFLVPD